MEDPLERAVILGTVMVGALLLLWTSVPAGHADARPARDDCVVTAVQDARAFAAVLGDERSVPASFAVQSCAEG